MAVQLFKTFLNQILYPIIIPAKWNIAIVWLFKTGQTNEKAHGQGRVAEMGS